MKCQAPHLYPNRRRALSSHQRHPLNRPHPPRSPTHPDDFARQLAPHATNPLHPPHHTPCITLHRLPRDLPSTTFTLHALCHHHIAPHTPHPPNQPPTASPAPTPLSTS